MASANNSSRMHTDKMSISFVTHGEINRDEYFIVPHGYVINIFREFIHKKYLIKSRVNYCNK